MYGTGKSRPTEIRTTLDHRFEPSPFLPQKTPRPSDGYSSIKGRNPGIDILSEAETIPHTFIIRVFLALMPGSSSPTSQLPQLAKYLDQGQVVLSAAEGATAARR